MTSRRVREEGPRRPPTGVAIGAIVAGRYEVVRSVGHGDTAEVVCARHRTTGAEVAIKYFRGRRGPDAPRLRREIAMLRMLRLPGVVELLDEGVHHDRPFLVMPFVQGRPFPGMPAPASWDEIAPQTIAVLDTLARVHGAGIVHRDIKPANVLVEDDRAVKILDFGIAWSSALSAGLTEAERFLGTPAYLAPEQMRGLPPDPRSDLYSLGVMLFEALSGRLPHSVTDRTGFAVARGSAPPPSLRSAAPGLPVRVAAVVERMLAPDPSDRPSSAAEVLVALERAPVSRARPLLPWLGPRAPIDALVAAARSGESCFVAGDPGLGKTRALLEAEEILLREGREVVRLVSAEYPLESLEPLLGGQRETDAGAEVVLREAAENVRRALARGTVVIADDAPRLDAISGGILASCKGSGAVLSSGPPSSAPVGERFVSLRALDEAALRDLFVGLERVSHVPEDAARLLFVRTEGLPRVVEAEMASLARQHVVHPDGEKWRTTRSAVERVVEASQADLLLSGALASRERPSAALHELLAYVAFLSPHARVDALVGATRMARFRVELGLADLQRRGFVRTEQDGTVVPCWPRFSLPEWPPEKVAEAHRQAAEALPQGAPRRLFHLLAVAMEGEPNGEARVLDEACVRAERLAAEGRVSTALAVVHDAVETLLEVGGARLRGGALARAFAIWAELSLMEQAVPEMDRLLCEILRVPRRSAKLRAIEALLAAAVAFRRGAPDSLSLVEAVPPFGAVRLDRQRHAVRVLAARRHSVAIEERVVAEAVRWAEGTGAPEALAAAHGFRGRLGYRRERFAQAAEHHERAAALEALPSLRMAARLNAASAWLEAFRHADAERLAVAAGVEARERRSPFFEARAEWLCRTARFRAGQRLTPDEELVEATAELNVPDQLAVTCLTEAAIAWHAGLDEVALRLAQRTREIWQRLENADGACFAACLEVAAGASVSEDEIRRLARRAVASTGAHVAFQGMALVASRLCERDELVSRVREAVSSMDEGLRSLRADVLSPDEAVALAEGRLQRMSSTRSE